jgi:hypothetical protein
MIFLSSRLPVILSGANQDTTVSSGKRPCYPASSADQRSEVT